MSDQFSSASEANNQDYEETPSASTAPQEPLVEEGRCPICGELFNDCEYFQRLENE